MNRSGPHVRFQLTAMDLSSLKARGCFCWREYEHARERGARIYAEIAGYGATCEAFHRVRMSESPEEPARAITLALGEARTCPKIFSM